MKLHDTDYVLVNSKTKTPIEGFDVVYGGEESIRDFLYDGIYYEDEVEEIIEKLKVDGIAVIDSVFDYALMSITKLPIDIQLKYIETFSQYKTCDRCCYDITDDENNIMEHYCIDDELYTP